MVDPGKPWLQYVLEREAWTQDFIATLRAASGLPNGRFLKAIADQVWLQGGQTMTGAQAATAWLARHRP